MHEQIAALRHEIERSRSTIVITGAGISMSAGILDMEHMNVLQVAQTSVEALVRLHPERSYRLLRKSFLNAIFDTGPSITHRKIAELEHQGLVHGVITTNIDHLHSLAGSREVAEIQGSYAINRCLSCRLSDDDIDIWNRGTAPRCRACGGIVVSFPVYTHVGVNQPEYDRAGAWVSQADLVITVGSKGMYGGYLRDLNPTARLVQVNPKPTTFDDLATFTIRAEADDVFSEL
ncbi:NAD-dependent protein deacetylase [Agromyces luteolus]|uniref:protein acetyllysine N-acetyltransferase n=1 Tax=Agromyces luteolus TaxID=88373 RepID=A0A7C9HJI5_9MICO|nr:Sir2 family NAD-dependent protein deacetylase [Agromyces luteolus]MUN08583.1 NAD-dependent protein deacetylase [Agromyces luteolus]GLK27120.1 NAD-dependent protein deacetylase [Agromyces luteolus]